MIVLLAAILISPLNLLVVLYFISKYKHPKEVVKTPENRSGEVEKLSEKDNNGNEDKNSQIVRELIDNPDIIDEWFNGKEG